MSATHTFAILEVSKRTFDDISGRLIAAGYEHCFKTTGAGVKIVDMNEIALAVDGQKSPVSRRGTSKRKT